MTNTQNSIAPKLYKNKTALLVEVEAPISCNGLHFL